MKIIFAGTPEFAADSLRVLISSKHDVVAVYTQPDRPAGRGKKPQKSPVKQVAEQNDISIYQPIKLNEKAEIDELAALQADLMIVAAYGLLLPKAILALPKQGCINIHASLLPRWRGAAPIQRAIQAGDSETGITIMQMDIGLDTGKMLLKIPTSISKKDTSGSLHDRLSKMGAQAMLDYLDKSESQTIAGEAQDNNLACYANKLSKQEAEIDWAQDAQQICRNIRAFNPWPVAFLIHNDQRIRIHDAEHFDWQSDSPAGCIVEKSKQGIVIRAAKGAVRVLKLQLPGAKAITAQDFFNGGKAILEVNTHLVSTNQINAKPANS